MEIRGSSNNFISLFTFGEGERNKTTKSRILDPVKGDEKINVQCTGLNEHKSGILFWVW